MQGGYRDHCSNQRAAWGKKAFAGQWAAAADLPQPPGSQHGRDGQELLQQRARGGAAVERGLRSGPDSLGEGALAGKVARRRFGWLDRTRSMEGAGVAACGGARHSLWQCLHSTAREHWLVASSAGDTSASGADSREVVTGLRISVTQLSNIPRSGPSTCARLRTRMLRTTSKLCPSQQVCRMWEQRAGSTSTVHRSSLYLEHRTTAVRYQNKLQHCVLIPRCNCKVKHTNRCSRSVSQQCLSQSGHRLAQALPARHFMGTARAGGQTGKQIGPEIAHLALHHRLHPNCQPVVSTCVMHEAGTCEAHRAARSVAIRVGSHPGQPEPR
jgi:hypothetical protein